MKSRFSEFAFMLFAGMDGANGIAGSADAIVLLRSPITKKRRPQGDFFKHARHVVSPGNEASLDQPGLSQLVGESFYW